MQCVKVNSCQFYQRNLNAYKCCPSDELSPSSMIFFTAVCHSFHVLMLQHAFSGRSWPRSPEDLSQIRYIQTWSRWQRGSPDFNSSFIQLPNLKNASKIYTSHISKLDTNYIHIHRKHCPKVSNDHQDAMPTSIGKDFNDQVCANLEDTSCMPAWHAISFSHLEKWTHNPSSHSTIWIDSTFHLHLTWSFEIMLQNQTSKPLLSETTLNSQTNQFHQESWVSSSW